MIYFDVLLHGNTGVYLGLQGVTRGYRRLQWVTWGYKGLLEVTRAYRGKQRTINPCLYCLKRLVYERERHQIVFQGVIWLQQTVNKISNFWPKPWTNLFGKMPILGFLKRCFPCPERLVCYIKGRRSFFHDLFSRSITWEYRGLQGVRWADRGLDGVTGAYKGLQ